jgi:uncharacterized cupin superfamily protein
MGEPNIYRPVREEPAGRTPQEGFLSHRQLVGRRVGAERLGASLWQVPPGQASYPYHYHLTEEELLVVVEGDGGRLRTPDGWRSLEPGDVLSFRTGADGAHQLFNDGPGELRFLSVSTYGAPDICVYPDTDTLCAAERGPNGTGLWEVFRRRDSVPYWTDAVPPEKP